MKCTAARDSHVDQSVDLHVEMGGVGEISALNRCEGCYKFRAELGLDSELSLLIKDRRWRLRPTLYPSGQGMFMAHVSSWEAQLNIHT